ncbi:MAG: SIS domain-containing protein [Firmicutes bacterium]|nr:SIS domain-containing protein [Bacillota bacterium]
MQNTIRNSIEQAQQIYMGLTCMIPQIENAAQIITKRLLSGGKLIVMGNGGSAADAQHITAELVGRFETDHKPIPAIAITTNSSILTAVSNDFGFDDVFLRQVKAFAKPEDVILAISTSGTSPNINKAVEFAKSAGAAIIGLSGKDGGHLKDLCDECLIISSGRTCRIQEAHILIGHILCELIELNMPQ